MFRDPDFIDCIAPTIRKVGFLRRADTVAAFGVTRDDWQREASARLSQVIRLPIGWDGHQGRPVAPTIAEYAYRLLEAILQRPKVPLPTITALSYGGIVLEWHRRGWDVEIEIEAPGRHNIYLHELATGTEEDFTVGADLARLRPVLSKISD